jgi:extracellular factor (EF) 3-hydroxypalmitic acid methyl ester biosynthesis protein
MYTHAVRERSAFSPPISLARPSSADGGTSAAVQQLLGSVHARIADFEVSSGVAMLCDELTSLHRTLSPEGWAAVIGQCRSDPLRSVIHQAPISARAYARPRGYPGDAETLDLIYGHAALPGGLSPLAAMLYSCEMQMSAAVSVRSRRELLASLIDEVALERPMPRVLSVACGHLREVELSAAVSAGELGAFDALDQDEQSLALVQREHADRNIRTIPGSVRTILKGEPPLRDYDLVYAAGLYDYLDRTVSARLTAALFAALRSGGRLLVANFANGVREAAYMEAYMAWPLIYRREDEVAQFQELIPTEEIASHRLFSDRVRNVIYLELRRA